MSRHANTTEKATIRPDYWLIARTISEDYLGADVPKVAGQVREVYLYDAHKATFLCELTPSYELRYLYTTVEYDDCPPDVEADLCAEASDVYVHCADIDAAPSWQKYHIGEPDKDDTEDDVAEYFDCNRVL